METVGIRELKSQTSRILQHVRDARAAIAVTHRGRVIAHIVPATPSSEDAQASQVWTDMDRLAEEIDARWPNGVSAVDAVREGRREL